MPSVVAILEITLIFVVVRLERSTDQVIKPINIEALSKWVGQIPEDVVRDMADVAPMLATLGYDPNANPPNYGKPDEFVEKNMKLLERNKDDWNAKQSQLMSIRESIRNSLIKQKNNNLNTIDNNLIDVNVNHQTSDQTITWYLSSDDRLPIGSNSSDNLFQFSDNRVVDSFDTLATLSSNFRTIFNFK